MTFAQDPFYIVKDEIQESIYNLQVTFHRWKQTPPKTGEHVHLTKEIISSCESIHWQVDELNKTIAVAAQDPAYYGLDVLELEKRRRWTAMAHNEVDNVSKAMAAEGETGSSVSPGLSRAHQDLMRRPNDYASQAGRFHHIANDNDDFISSESDVQQLLIRQQDEELDEISASVQRIGGLGLTIHEELTGQDKILEELSLEMETTSNRLDFVQKKVAMVLKKASTKGQMMMIAFLVVLFIILFILVFFT